MVILDAMMLIPRHYYQWYAGNVLAVAIAQMVSVWLRNDVKEHFDYILQCMILWLTRATRWVKLK